MPYFYFDLIRDEALDPDEIGLRLPDAEAAYLSCFDALGDIIKDGVQKKTEPQLIAIRVRDEAGLQVAELRAVVEAEKLGLSSRS